MRLSVSFLFLIFFFLCFRGTPQANNNKTDGKIQLKKIIEFIKKSEFDSAFTRAVKAEVYYRQLNDSLGIGEAILRQGEVKHYLKEDQKALFYYNKAAKYLLPVANDSIMFTLGYYNLAGGIRMNLGYQADARMLLEKEYQLCLKYSNDQSPAFSTINYNLGLNCIYFGEYELGIKFFKTALPLYLKEYGAYGKRVAQLYNNVGILYTEQGDYARALDYFDRAIEIHMHNEGPGYWNLAYNYNGKASVYDYMNDLDKAYEFHQKALAICIKQPYLDRVETVTRGALAAYYSKQNQTKLAFKEIDNAIRLITKKFFDRHPRLIDLYQIKGDIYVTTGDLKTAQVWYSKAENIAISTYGKTHPLLARLHEKEAMALIQKNAYSEALRKVDEGIKAVQGNKGSNQDQFAGILDMKVYLNLVDQKARIYTLISESKTDPVPDMNLALNEYMIAVKIADRIRSGYLEEDSKIFLQSNLRSVYENALDLCYQLNTLTNDSAYINHAFLFIEKSKASVLSESLQSHALSNINGIPKEIISKEENISRQLKNIKLQLEESSSENPAVRDSLENELFNYELSQDSLSSIIKEKYPKYYQLKYNSDIISLKKAAKRLGNNKAAILYFEGDSAWYILSVYAKKLKFHRVYKSLVQNQIEKSITLIRDASSSINEYNDAAHSVYKHLVENMLPAGMITRNLLIIPDGPLGYFPFEALPAKQYTPGSKPHYMINDFRIMYGTSLTLHFNTNTKEILFSNDYIGFAPAYHSTDTSLQSRSGFRANTTPLAGIEEEVKYAAGLFNGAYYLAEDATESNFKLHHAPSRIIHLAMHAQTDDQNPMHSRLLFTSADSIDDGYLNAYELYALELHSELAVLSACNTGSGEFKRGEGIMSLSRAFMYAGCSNVVMSLWQARDLPTAEIMKSFFSNLKKRQHKDEALHNAKLRYLDKADPLEAHPAYWATFIFMGDNKPIITNTGYESFLLYGSLIIFIFIAIVFLYNKKRHADS